MVAVTGRMGRTSTRPSTATGRSSIVPTRTSSGILYIQLSGANPIGSPNIPMLVTAALPNGELASPSARIDLSRSPVSHAAPRSAMRSSGIGSASIVLLLFANSASRPSFAARLRSPSSCATSIADLRSTFLTFTPVRSRPPSTAVWKNTSIELRGMTCSPTIRTFISGTSRSVTATARPTRCVGVTLCPRSRQAERKAFRFVASTSSAP